MDLARRAAEARTAGDLSGAIELYTRAEREAATTADRLYLTMRRAYCLIDVGRMEEAVVIAQQVVNESRTHDIIPVLCDGLGLLVDDHMLHDRIAEATDLLAEARFLLDEVPDAPGLFQVVHNLAVTYERCDFPAVALGIFERALRLADNSVDRTFVRTAMVDAHYLAAMYETDPVQRAAHVAAGLRVADEVLATSDDKEVVAETAALAHSAVFLCEQGRYAEALADAMTARAAAEANGWSSELLVALLAEAIARWRLERDPTCVELIERAWDLAEGPWSRRFPAAASSVLVEALREIGDPERLHRAIDRRQQVLEDDLRRERAGRLAHVQLGVAHRHTERISETDPLTGLYNRRYLSRLLPDAITRFSPVTVAVFDLDGFKQINDDFSYEHGDRLIQQMAGVLTRSCRAGDCVCRLGGDEFVMVLNNLSPEQAMLVLERIREDIAAVSWSGLPPDRTLTSSVGLAATSSPADAHRVVADAAGALRSAKRSGRNRVSIAVPGERPAT